MTTPVTVRSRVRAALDQAWAAAEAAGTLPVHPADVPRPHVEVERPAKPEHGDLATNLALKLARPLPPAAARDRDARSPRRWPRRQRRPDDRLADRVGRGRAARVHQPAADATAPWTRRSTASSPTPRALGPRRRRRARATVNVEFVSANPTGPLTIGNARGAFVGDLLCRVLEAGGQRVTREYYFNDSGGQVDNLGASVAGDPARRADPRGRLPRRLRRRSRGGACRPTSWAAADGRRRRRGRHRRAAGPPGGSGPASRRSLERARRPLRRLDERGLAPRRRLGRAGGRAAPRAAATSTSRTARRGSARRRSATTRTGSIIRSERRADLLRRRHRLRDREVQPRLRPPHLHLGRGPPRDGRPGPQRGRGDGLSTRAAVQVLLTGWVRFVRDGAGGLDEQAGRRVHHPRRRCWPRSASTPPAGSSPHAAPTSASTSTSSWPRSSRTRTRSTTSSTPTPGSPRSCARRPRPGSTPAARVAGALAGAPEAALARAIVRASRRSSRTRPRPRRRTAITAYATELATPFHAFYRDARVVDADEPERSAARLALVAAARITLANALGLLGISAPESM